MHLRLIWKFQLVYSVVVQVLMGTSWTAHNLCQLTGGVPVMFNVLVLTFKALNGLGPMYLLDHLLWYVPWRALHY